jgi:hypothetical protein
MTCFLLDNKQSGWISGQTFAVDAGRSTYLFLCDALLFFILVFTFGIKLRKSAGYNYVYYYYDSKYRSKTLILI